MTDPASTTADDPAPRDGWMVRWTESLAWPGWELPVVMRSVASQLISMTARFAAPAEELGARLDAVQSQVARRLAQAEILRQDLDAVRASMAALEHRVAALEVRVREDVAQDDDAPEVPRLSLPSRDAFREVLARAGELAAQRGLKTGADSATIVDDHGLETHAEATPPARRARNQSAKPRGRA